MVNNRLAKYVSFNQFFKMKTTNKNPKSDSTKLLSVVVIGLNEELRLDSALRSVVKTCPEGWDLEIFYVDSGSTDNSVKIASEVQGVKVLNLNTEFPSAAKARNIGLKQVGGEFVQLLDGDSILQFDWQSEAISYLVDNPDVACVFGHCIEMCPYQSIYMQVCALDWHVSPGDYRLSGGNAMWRRSAFDAVGFFDEKFRFGEEPDLCYRIRQNGWRIVCIDVPMVKHDLAMNSFGQYWRRAINSGKAYASVARRYWRSAEKLWLYESIRNFIEPVIWIGVYLFGSMLYGWMAGLFLIFGWWLFRGAVIAVKVRQRSANYIEALAYGLHVQFVRLPICFGQLAVFLKSRNI